MAGVLNGIMTTCGTTLKCHHCYCKSLLQQPFGSDGGTSPAGSSRLLPRSSSVARLGREADIGQVVFKTRGKDGIIKVYRSGSHHHHRFVASDPPISSDFSGTKCPTAEKTYKL